MSRVTDFPDDEEEKLSRAETEAEESEEREPLKMPQVGGRVSRFYQAVKLEMRKTSWPARNDVWSTTVVVLIAIVFFGFYLFGVDVLITLGFESLKKVVGQ